MDSEIFLHHIDAVESFVFDLIATSRINGFFESQWEVQRILLNWKAGRETNNTEFICFYQYVHHIIGDYLWEEEDDRLRELFNKLFELLIEAECILFPYCIDE